MFNGKTKAMSMLYLRRRRGSCLKAGDNRKGAGPPLPPPSKEGLGPLGSLNICIATSGGAGTNGPSGLPTLSYYRSLVSSLMIKIMRRVNSHF